MIHSSTVAQRSVFQQSQNQEILPKSQPVAKDAPQMSSTPSEQQPSSKKSPRRSNKPIFNWFQRKLGGHVKHKALADRPQVSIDSDATRGRPGVRQNRVPSSPLPASSRRDSTKQQIKLDPTRRRAVSLNDEEELRDRVGEDDDQSFFGASSFARDSTWSPALGADDDASVRPIPPSIPPSPSPSPSLSSYLSNPHTFRSMTASTKPTTVLSIDLAPNGVAHIAQVPGTPLSHVSRFPPHVRSASLNTNPGLLGSGASVTFSAFPPSPQSSSRPSSLRLAGPVNASGSGNQRPAPHGYDPISTVQAPLHTTHHPRNNPRPSSPPLDNASMLTLASSAFAFGGSRFAMPGWSSTPSALGGSDSVSQFGGAYADGESTSQFVVGEEDRLEERDGNSSVFALRPRSSRRGSWDSETSAWSAQLPAGVTSPSLRRSLLTNNTDGLFSVDNDETDRQSGGRDGRDDASQSQSGSLSADTAPRDGSTGGDSASARVVSSSLSENVHSSAKGVDAPTQTPPVVSDRLERNLSTDTVSRVEPTDEDPAKVARPVELILA